MKKKILTIILVVIVLLGITGCYGIKNEFNVGEKSDVKITKDKVSFTARNITNTGATFDLKNNTDKPVQYRDKYEMEIKQDGEWHKINVQLLFSSLLYSFLKPNEEIQIQLNWENAYGKLANGTYRIVKDINYEKEEDVYDNFYIAAEFTIE